MTIVHYKAKMIRGFTLIELMITVVIIGVIAAIAYPTYVDYIAEGGRAEGLAALMHVSNLQEQYYMDNRVYAEDMALLGLNADPFVTNGGLYKIDSTGTDSFTIVATAQDDQASRDSACTTIELTDTGAKTPSECW